MYDIKQVFDQVQYHRWFQIPLMLSMVVLLIIDHCSFASETPPNFQMIRNQKIWDQGAHNAFTDLVWFRDRFFCVFREGEGHVSQEANIRILSSPDGSDWEPSGLLSLEGYDLRDPKIDVHADGKTLMVLGGGAVRKGNEPASKHHSFVSLSTDGKEWSPIEWVAEEGQWLWRITWFKEIAYGIAYDVRPESRSQRKYGTTLLKSTDGKNYTIVVSDLYHESGPTEATLRFAPDGTCYCLQRRDGKESNTALLGVSQPPYTNWQWKDLGLYYGGPDFIQIPDGRWIAAGRIITDKVAKTVVCELNVAEGKLIPLVTLPSGGDNSYPGMVWHDGKLWISYYSSHEDKTNIYLAVLSSTQQ
ncbi:MAG: exo-alpha-sialidase [Candidatus Omnitrophota bacterium]|jgi:hypothetical protein|nr:MAG: exo-alpha-sialidase [Candidatus Omnitrophota bacterium]